jgi:hypothetical protein
VAAKQRIAIAANRLTKHDLGLTNKCENWTHFNSMTIPQQLTRFPVLNVKPHSKEPAEANGVKDARVGRTIAPGNNYGVAGGNGLLIVDCDSKPNKPGVANFQALADKHGGCPETFMVETPGGGCHLYFTTPADWSCASRNDALAPGVDIKCRDGYVVGPGSTNGTGSYSVACAAPVAPAPPWLLELLTRPERKATKKAASKDKPDAETVRRALAAIPPEDHYEDWLRIGMALHSWDATAGLELWENWSKGAASWEEGACAAKWSTFAPSEITIATVLHLAREAGWTPEPPPVKPGVLEHFYFDSPTNKFWCRGSNLGWQLLGVDATKRRLAALGVDPDKRKGDLLSAADFALDTITRTRAVDGAFPGFFRTAELIQQHGQVLLNTSRLRPLHPDAAPHPEPWGFPWLDAYLSKLLGEQQKIVFCAWLAHFYRAALAGCPNRGLALFLAGPSGAGKSFLTKFVLRNLFGRVEEATAFLCGADQFNESLFSAPIWNVDDAIAASDTRTHARFSQAVKAAVANDEMTMRAMYRAGVKMPWNGRLIVTMNDDPESIRLLPHGEGSMVDKYILLRAGATFEKFPDDAELLPELPHFAAWLRDMPCDPCVWIGGRFGILAYQQPDLVTVAQQESTTFSVLELVQTWFEGWLEANPRQAWEGSPTALIGLLAEDERTAGICHSMRLTPAALGRALNKLILDRIAGLSKLPRSKKSRRYRITADLLGDS